MPKAKDGTHITQKQYKVLAMQAAHGAAHLLSIGVGQNIKASGFPSLKKCDADAAAIWAAFRETKQLNADPGKLYELTTTTGEIPSRGTILAKLTELVQGAGAEDRIVFFFSGHGHRLNENFYLVPSDAYSSEDPDGLLLFDRVIEILNSSAAKQKIIILDACFSGPEITKKFGSQPMSFKFLTEYLAKTKGVVVLSSSESDQTSTTKSPNPKLSLFTHFIVMGLRGDTAALDGHYLTVPSLYSYVSKKVMSVSKSHGSVQKPGINMKADGTIMLADFTPCLVTPDEVDLGESPVEKLQFKDSESQNVTDILTYISNWGNYSAEWIEKTANSVLNEFIEQDLGRKKTTLRTALGWSSSDVVIEPTGLSFPAGRYTVRYLARDKKSGSLVHKVTLEPEWFNRPDDIPKIIRSLGMTPTSMKLFLTKPCDPTSMIPGLEASGWELTSELNDEISARRDGYSLTVSAESVTLNGLAPSDIFGATSNKDKARIAMSVISLLPS